LANILSSKTLVILAIVFIIGAAIGIYYYNTRTGAVQETSTPTSPSPTNETPTTTTQPSTTTTMESPTESPTTTPPPNNLTPITGELSQEEKALAEGFINTLNTFISLTSSYQNTYPLQYSGGLLPVFSMPFPGLSIIDEIEMKLQSKMHIVGRYFGAAMEILSTSNGISISKYVGTVELDGKTYYNHSLTVNITFFENQTYENQSMTRNSSVIMRGWILTSEDMKETIYRANVSTNIGNESIQSSFETTTIFDDEYRPIKIKITSYTVTEPNVTVEIDYENGLARFHMGNNTTVLSLNNTSSLWSIRIGTVEEKVIDGVKFYILRCNLYYNDTLMGYMDYLLSEDGVPVSFYHGYIMVVEKEMDMYRSYELTIDTTNLKPRK